VRRNEVVDYWTRTCDSCSLHIPMGDRLNKVSTTRWNESPGIAHYGFQDTFESHLCDQCYFAARLEGKL
jgi:hypothetical protein